MVQTSQLRQFADGPTRVENNSLSFAAAAPLAISRRNGHGEGGPGEEATEKLILCNRRDKIEIY